MSREQLNARNRAAEQRLSIYMVGHSATRTGSPIVFKNLVTWLSRNTDWRFELAFRSGGPLLDQFAQIAPTIDLDYDSQLRRIGRAETVLHALQLDGYAPKARQRRLDRRRVRPKDCDLVWVNSVSALACIDRRTRAPMVLHVHEMGDALRRALHPDEFDRITSMPTHYVAASDSVADSLLQIGVPPRAITTVPGFIEVPPEAATVLPTPGGSRYVLGCGTTGFQKGTDLFLQAALQSTRRGDDYQWVWLGAGLHLDDDAAFRNEIRKAGLSDILRLEPAVADPAPWFRGASVFALTSREDSFPLVALEAAASMTPVVCFSNSGGAPELVGRGAGSVVPYGDCLALADAVRTYAKDDELAARTGRRARALVTGSYSVEAIMPRLVDLITDVACSRTERGSS